jgi:transposase
MVKLAGAETAVALFVMQLCYLRSIFAMLFPTQWQECFFAGHVTAFAYFGGVPQRISYDLKTAVK